MCYNFKLNHDSEKLEHRFKAILKANILYVNADRINGFTFPKTPVITNNNIQLIQLFNWGLIPNWANDESIRAKTLNARIETINDLPSFKNNVKNRCLILAEGFYEWKWLDAKGKEKQQYLITLPNDELFAFAGIYSEWTNKKTGELFQTYSIVTTDANPFMAEIHNMKKRMPVILTPNNENEWLKETIKPDAFKTCNIELKAIEI